MKLGFLITMLSVFTQAAFAQTDTVRIIRGNQLTIEQRKAASDPCAGEKASSQDCADYTARKAALDKYNAELEKASQKPEDTALTVNAVPASSN